MFRKIVRSIQRFGVTSSVAMVGYAINYYIHRYVLRADYLVRPIHDYRMQLDIHDQGISRAIAIRGTREPQLKFLLERTLKPGWAVLDVGANIGYYTLMMAKRTGPTGKIYAIEPEAKNFALLQSNVSLNGLDNMVETFHMGAARAPGVERLYTHARSNLHSFVSAESSHGSSDGRSGEWEDVPVTDLSSFIADKRPIDFLRMDIEGYEVDVLNGLEKAIEDGTFTGSIVFECHRPRYDRETRDITKPLRMLHRHGYHARYMTSNDENNGLIRDAGYRPIAVIPTSDFRSSGIYENVKEEDVVTLISESGGVRDVLFSRGA